jgi:hypothetical protein
MLRPSEEYSSEDSEIEKEYDDNDFLIIPKEKNYYGVKTM